MPGTEHTAAGRAAVSRAAVRTSNLDFHLYEWGAGAPLLMLHGFPDHGFAWRPLAERLAPVYRVLAPDLRGYGRTGRPTRTDAYSIDTLVNDIGALLGALEIPRVVLCGHDWGGVLAFAYAARYPERVAALIAFNAPPLPVLQDMIVTDPAQRAASQYIRLLRSSEADALFCESKVDALIDRFLGDAQRGGLIDARDVAAYREAWSGDGAWQAMLAWYRAAPLAIPNDDAPFVPPASRAEPVAACPVQLVWGDRDTVFVPAMADRVSAYLPDCRTTRLSCAGHMPQRDDPARCAALVANFLADVPGWGPSRSLI